MRIFCASLVCIIFFFSPLFVCQELQAYSVSYYACFFGINNTFFSNIEYLLYRSHPQSVISTDLLLLVSWGWDTFFFLLKLAYSSYYNSYALFYVCLFQRWKEDTRAIMQMTWFACVRLRIGIRPKISKYQWSWNVLQEREKVQKQGTVLWGWISKY